MTGQTPPARDLHLPSGITVPAELAAAAMHVYLLGWIVHSDDIHAPDPRHNLYSARYNAYHDHQKPVEDAFADTFTPVQLEQLARTLAGPGSYSAAFVRADMPAGAALARAALLQTGYVTYRLTLLADQGITGDAAWALLGLETHPVRIHSNLSYFYDNDPLTCPYPQPETSPQPLKRTATTR